MGLRFNFYSYDFGESAGTEGDGSNGINLGSSNASGFDIGFQGVLNKKYYVAYYIKNISSFTFKVSIILISQFILFVILLH